MNGRLHLWWRFPLVFGALLACLVALLWLGWRAYGDLLDAQGLRLRSEKVLATLALLDRQTVPDGGLALCASVGAPVGPPRDPKLADPTPALASLRDLLHDNASQLERLAVLTSALTEWRMTITAPLEKTCADGQRLGAAYVQSMLRVATPTQMSIRTELGALRRTEQGLQTEREARVQAAIHWSRQLLGLVAAASVLIGVAAVLAMRGFAGQLSESERRLRREAAQRGVAEDQLNDSQRRLRMVLEHSSDAVIAFDKTGKVQWLNPAAEVMFHRARQAVAGGSIGDLIPSLQDDLDWPVTRPQAESEGLTPVPWTTRRELTEGARPGGELFPVEIALVQSRLDGDRLGICVVHDQSERQHIEKLKGEFVALIGHEMRAPLSRVLASVVASCDVTSLEPGLRQQLLLARGDGERLLSLLDDVIELEYLRSGEPALRIAPLDLVELAREALLTVSPRAARQQVVLLPQIEVDTLPVLGDARLLTQVLMRQLIDAIDATPGGGDVQLVAHMTPQGDARIGVIDSGARPTPAFMQRAFEAFAITDEATGVRERGGNGVTLAICHAIVTGLGGRMAIEPVPGDRGACIWFSLPMRTGAR